MSKPKVVVVDYGASNTFSVISAFEYCGANVRLSDSSAEIEIADFLILPGVGAFPDGINNLVSLGLDEAIWRFSQTERPLMGICLGMQLLATTGDEFGRHNGLNLLKGSVIKLPELTVDGKKLRLPNIGWIKTLSSNEPHENDHGFFKYLNDKWFYAAHSFHFNPSGNIDAAVRFDYGGHLIVGALQHENIVGCQFHPERSGKSGVDVIERFLKL